MRRLLRSKDCRCTAGQKREGTLFLVGTLYLYTGDWPLIGGEGTLRTRIIAVQEAKKEVVSLFCFEVTKR